MNKSEAETGFYLKKPRFYLKRAEIVCSVCGIRAVQKILWNNHEPMPFALPSGWFVVRYGDPHRLSGVCSAECAERLPRLT